MLACQQACQQAYQQYVFQGLDLMHTTSCILEKPHVKVCASCGAQVFKLQSSKHMQNSKQVSKHESDVMTESDRRFDRCRNQIWFCDSMMHALILKIWFCLDYSFNGVQLQVCAWIRCFAMKKLQHTDDSAPFPGALRSSRLNHVSILALSASILEQT